MTPEERIKLTIGSVNDRIREAEDESAKLVEVLKSQRAGAIRTELARPDGASARAIGKVLGVSHTAVNDWRDAK